MKKCTLKRVLLTLFCYLLKDWIIIDLMKAITRFFQDLGSGIKDVFKGPSKTDNLFSLNGRPPLHRSLLFGIQHVLAMFVANVTPVLIVFGVLQTKGLDQSFVVNAIQSCLFMAGVCTILQVLVGARLPIVVGTSFTFLSVLLTIINDTTAGGGTTLDAYYTMFGAIFIGSIVMGTFSCFYKFWGRLIKPIVPVLVVLGIGLSLLPSAATDFVGGSSVLSSIISGGSSSTPVPFYVYIIVASATLISGILWSLFAKGVWKNLSVVFAIVFGYVVACCIPNLVDFSILNIAEGGVHIEEIITYPHPLNMSEMFSHIKLVPCILLTVIFLVSAVETIGDTTALAVSGLGREPTSREMCGCLPFDGFNSTLACCFGCLPLTSYSENVGLVAQTKVVNRFTIFMGSLVLILAGIVRVFALSILTIPNCVLGGVMVILFGSIMMVGIRMLSEQGFSDKNVLIASISITLGFGITLVSDLFTALDKLNLSWLGDILSNCVLNIFVLAFILSWALPESMHINLFHRKHK